VYLSAVFVNLLYVIQLVLVALSFTFLFMFGVSLLKPTGRLKWLSTAPTVLLAFWVFVTFFVLTPIYQDETVWHHVSNALARYFIAFPGGLLAAYALRSHAKWRILPLGVPAVYNALRVTGVSLAAYALLGGLLPLPIPFWPGNILNTETFESWLGIPPLVFRTLIGLVLAVSTIRALEIFNLETQRKIETLERDSILNVERERLARDLHDGALQKVYTAGLLVRSVSKLIEPGNEASRRLEQSVAALNDAVTDLRSNLKTLHAGTSASVEPLADLLQHVAAEPHYTSMVNIKLETLFPSEFTLSPLRSGHVMGIVNEAMSNILRHARARNVLIHAERRGDLLRITIRDDGVGFTAGGEAGYGVQNMRDRARLLNGALEIDSVIGRGTMVALEIPWMDQP
jgi:signal transduction histidine kinase